MDRDLSLLEGLTQHVEASMLQSKETRAWGGPRYELVHSPRLRFNASVRESDRGVPRYVLNRGIGIALLDVSMALASDPVFARDLTLDPEDVITLNAADLGFLPGPPRDRFVDYRPKGAGTRSGHALIAFGLPKYTENPMRQHVGDLLFELGLRFVSLHEQAHVYQGHLHFLAALGLPLRWAEFDAAEGDNPTVNDHPIPPRTRQALELQADAFAAHVLLDRFMEKGPRLVYPDSDVIRTSGDWARFAFLSMTVVFAVLERADRSLHSDPADRAHPDARVRLLAAFLVLRWSLFRHVSSDEVRTDLIHRVLADSACIFDLVGASPFAPDAFREYLARRSSEPRSPTARALSDLHAVLQRLEGDLERCSYQAREAYGL